MTETMDVGFLNPLVQKFFQGNTATLSSDANGDIFMKSGWHQQKEYVLDALSAYLHELLPEGVLYVFSPDHSFKYNHSGQGITSLRMCDSRPGESTFKHSLEDIAETAAENSKKQQPTLANVLFYDAPSVERWVEELRGGIWHKLNGYSLSVEPQKLDVYTEVKGHKTKEMRLAFSVTLFKYVLTPPDKVKLPEPA